PDLDAERREHRVARMREARLEAAAARLAVRVLQLHAVDRGVRLHGELGRELDRPCLEDRGRGHELEGGSRRLRRGERDPGERADLAAASVERRHTAEARTERRY